MKNKNQFSRRDFLKSSSFATGAFATGSLVSCGNENSTGKKWETIYYKLPKKESDPNSYVAGLLFSQVGYEIDYPVRVIVRFPEKEMLSNSATCHLLPINQEEKYETSFVYWGELWKSHWFVAEFTGIAEEGEWGIEVHDSGKVVFKDEGLKVAKNIFWNSTIELSSVDILERRKHFTKVGAGWQDAGTLWAESPAQSAMIMALLDMLELTFDKYDEKFQNRIYEQIVIGCNYLVITQKKAKELGFPEGAMSHDVLGHEEIVIVNDISKAIVALYRAARILPNSFKEKKEEYKKSADLAYKWLLTKAKPNGDVSFNRRQRGLPQETVIPKDEYLTRDLIFLCWSGLEKSKFDEEGKEYCIKNAREIMERQITQEKAENGYYGHFREFKSLEHSENSWVHGIENRSFGADVGGIYPNYLMPFIEMLQLWPEHEDAPLWKKTLENFVYGFLVPACKKNPFYIVPNGVFGDEGLIWFAGPFHGTNTIYGFTAALLFEFAKIFDDNELKQIAYGNMQWLAGLNAGITKENLKACVIFSADVPEGVALPASMICNIGSRWAGTWFNTRGVICNGFSTGTQFKMDVDPTKENDGPFSLTDEDWIPHSAGWISALIRM